MANVDQAIEGRPCAVGGCEDPASPGFQGDEDNRYIHTNFCVRHRIEWVGYEKARQAEMRACLESVRDRFACAALTGVVVSAARVGLTAETAAVVAGAAFLLADAMMIARVKK